MRSLTKASLFLGALGLANLIACAPMGTPAGSSVPGGSAISGSGLDKAVAPYHNEPGTVYGIWTNSNVIPDFANNTNVQQDVTLYVGHSDSVLRLGCTENGKKVAGDIAAKMTTTATDKVIVFHQAVALHKDALCQIVMPTGTLPFRFEDKEMNHFVVMFDHTIFHFVRTGPMPAPAPAPAPVPPVHH